VKNFVRRLFSSLGFRLVIVVRMSSGKRVLWRCCFFKNDLVISPLLVFCYVVFFALVIIEIVKALLRLLKFCEA
jgi:hypothetical protein